MSRKLVERRRRGLDDKACRTPDSKRWHRMRVRSWAQGKPWIKEEPPAFSLYREECRARRSSRLADASPAVAINDCILCRFYQSSMDPPSTISSNPDGWKSNQESMVLLLSLGKDGLVSKQQIKLLQGVGVPKKQHIFKPPQREP